MYVDATGTNGVITGYAGTEPGPVSRPMRRPGTCDYAGRSSALR